MKTVAGRYLPTVCAMGVWVSLASGYVWGIEPPVYLHQFSALDAAAGDEFGRTLALDGQVAIIGAPSRDELGTDSGAAYVFDVATGQQLLKLLPEDGEPGDAFGVSVAIQGNLAVVGSLYDDDAGQSSGSAYVFDAMTGKQLYKLRAADAARFAEFGVSVALDDGIILVGAHKDGPGSAYLFDATTGDQLGKLQADDAQPDDLFGVSAALDDGKALIGAYYDDDHAIASGAAYIFDVATQQQLHKLTPHDGAQGDRFGLHLDIGGNRAVIGSRYDDDAIKSSGSAYIFDVTSGETLFKLVPHDTTPNDQFGSAVSISGDRVVIGAVDDDHNGIYAGSAYWFDVNTGDELYKFNAVDAQPLDRLGIAVAFTEDYVLLGASMVAYPGATELPSGKVYVYAVPEPGTLNWLWLGVCLRWTGCKRQNRAAARIQRRT
jgi:outer membrane protein assembly factor BamB